MISVIGAGAFGTALAISMARGGTRVTLWARDADHVARMQADRVNAARLPDMAFPEALRVTGDPEAFEALQRRLALRSLADPTPPACGPRAGSPSGIAD